MSSGRVVYQNGNLVPEEEARVSIFDSALMFGDMVFEMTRSFNKVQFKLRDHLKRLYAGIRILEIPLNLGLNDLEDICERVISANDPHFLPSDEHRLMINVSRGPLSIYSEVFGGTLEPTVIVADFPLKWTVSGMGALFDHGINAVIPAQRAIPSVFLDPKIKTRSRLHYQMANIEVSRTRGERNWALLLDGEGLIAEGTGDNFFIVCDGVVKTPFGRNILRGISREYIFSLCKELNISYVEAAIEPYDVYAADEAFMTGTPFCILPVSSLNSKPVGSSSMGPITRQLLDQWGSNVGLDIEQQIKSFNRETATNESGGSSPYQFRVQRSVGSQTRLVDGNWDEV